MQHTQLVLILAAKRRGGAERGRPQATGTQSVEPRPQATPLQPHMHATGSLLQPLLHPTTQVPGSQGLVSVASRPRAQKQIPMQSQAFLSSRCPRVAHVCCPLSWKACARRDPWRPAEPGVTGWFPSQPSLLPEHLSLCLPPCGVVAGLSTSSQSCLSLRWQPPPLAGHGLVAICPADCCGLLAYGYLTPPSEWAQGAGK